MDISDSERAEKSLDTLIERRHDQRRQTEGERAEEELWQASARIHAAKRQRELAAEWFAHEMKMCDVHAALSEEHWERAQKYRQSGHEGAA